MACPTYPASRPAARLVAIAARARRAFTLVEILIVVIILGILAAIVIPQFANASTDARRTNMTSQLQTLRAAVQLYRVQHQDTTPTLLTDGWPVLTSTTLVTGVVDPAGTLGPYLQSTPVNPLTNSDAIVAVGTAPATTTGWYFDVDTGQLHGANAAGAQSDTGD